MVSNEPTPADPITAEAIRDLAALRAAGLEQLLLLQLARFVELDRAGSPDAPSALAQAQLLDIEAHRAAGVARLDPGKFGIQGRVVDDAGAPISGAEVQAVDRGGNPLASAAANAGGYYNLSIQEPEPTLIGIVVRVANKIVHRENTIPLGPDQLLHLDLQVDISRAVP